VWDERFRALRGGPVHSHQARYEVSKVALSHSARQSDGRGERVMENEFGRSGSIWGVHTASFSMTGGTRKAMISDQPPGEAKHG